MKAVLRSASLVAGPVAALLAIQLLPESFVGPGGDTMPLTPQARAAAAVGLWMAIWWLTEAIPVYATALLPLALFPLLDVRSIKATAALYGHELIFLFLGGFIVALGLERWGVHRRIALAVLGSVGTRPAVLVGAFMALAAALSMWVTNTAAAIMLLPVAISIIRLLPAEDSAQSNFSTCLLLGMAYAASIGGIGTIIGTAPNIFIVSFVESQTGTQISFVAWMLIGVPLVVTFVPIAWWFLSRYAYPLTATPPPGVAEALSSLRARLGPMDRGERRMMAVFVATVLAWVCRPILNDWSILGRQPLAGLSDSGIAIISALALFCLPVRWRHREFLMDWETAVRLPWGLLILFGGGLSLAAALDQTGFSVFLGSQASALAGWPVPVTIAVVVAIMIFLTELTSNTATTATLIPVFYAVGIALGIEPLLLVLPAGIAASCAFMLPVATPPNAIVFGTGMISIPQMSRAGLGLNLIGIILITALTYSVIIPVLMSMD